MTKYCEREDATFWGKLKIDTRKIWRGKYHDLHDDIFLFYILGIIAILIMPVLIFVPMHDDPVEYAPMLIRVAMLYVWYVLILTYIQLVIIDKGGKNATKIIFYILLAILIMLLVLSFSYVVIEVFGTGD